jgi:diaminopimelate epimerase
MHGCGNDFIVTHKVTKNKIVSIKSIVPVLCDRHRGIGADGVILILPSEKADFKMVIFNSDGSIAEMCGNGIRCLALYVSEKNLSKKTMLHIETGAGIKTINRIGKQYKVDMGRPVLKAKKIPVKATAGSMILKPVVINNKRFLITAVSMGNPHAVIFENSLTDDLVLAYGKKIENHPLFPKKTNVEFVKIHSKKEISLRVFERGCGETLACGTGACASVVAGIITKKLDPKVMVHLPGGTLIVEWDGDTQHSVFMTGPAVTVFEGTLLF